MFEIPSHLAKPQIGMNDMNINFLLIYLFYLHNLQIKFNLIPKIT
jgi:hypothetical protein